MFVQSVQFPTFQAISIFLQIWLDGSNYHIFPLCFTQMKWKSRGRAHISTSAPYNFFTFFPAIYSTYNGSARKKSSRIFSCARVRIRLNEFSPSNMCLYTIAAALCKQTGRLMTSVAARIGYGYILPKVNANSAQIGTDDATWLWCNLRS